MTSKRMNAVLRGACHWVAVCTLVALPWSVGVTAHAQEDAEAAATRMERGRLADTDTLLALTSEGAVLYARDDVKLSGYQYCSQAVALAEAGEFRQSVRAASKALHLAQTTQNTDLRAQALRDLAIVYSYAGQLDKAQQFALDALGEKARDPQLVNGPAHKVLGDVARRRGDLPGAVRSYEEALAQSSPRYIPLVQASLANVLIEPGSAQDLVRARQLLDQLGTPKEPALAAQWARSRANLLLAENQPQQAKTLFAALTRRPMGSDGAYYRLWAWDGVARSDLALGDRRAASQALEQALDGIDKVRARFRSDEFKMGVFSDLQSIFERGVGVSADLGEAARALQISERSRSRALLDAVRGRAALDERVTARSDVAVLQQALRPDERVVEFHALPDRLLIWVVGPQEIRSHSLAVSSQELTELVETFRNALVRGRKVALSHGEKLGAALLGSLELPPGQRLIIVPHGPLHYLPFQALRLHGRYLIEDHPIAVAPSMGIAWQLVQHAPRADAMLTAFGNPRIEDRYDLPGSEAEVKELARLFPRNQLFIGEAATKTRFRQAAVVSPILHVAAHAEADPVDPLYSRILLANEGGQQNFLEAREILELPLQRTALVTLSACESGLGRIAQGDEVLGFTRSFLAAGTSSLIVSLWPVADDATELLMRTLYRELARGRMLQDAMQTAQTTVMKDARFAHPFFWAPFNLIGNWRLTLATPGA